MTPTEMETVLRNIDVRTARLEQILPLLATTEDHRHALTLHEALRSDIVLLAERVASLGHGSS